MTKLLFLFFFFFHLSFSVEDFIITSPGDSSFGSSVAIFGNYIIVGSPNSTVGSFVSEGKIFIYYEITLNQSYSDPFGASNDYFGSSVATDGTFFVIGAPSTVTNVGTVYVFNMPLTSWTELNPSDLRGVYHFGTSVCLDAGVIVIGSYATVRNNGQQGSVYIFNFTNSTWSQKQILVANDGASGDKFGASVTKSGDFIAIGAPFHLVGNNVNQGSVYIFQYNGSEWFQFQNLTALNGTQSIYFGNSVSIDQNFLIVGSHKDNSNQGAAYIFNFNGTSWIQIQKLTANDGNPNDQFGYSVAISGNFAIIGAPYKTLGTNIYQGASYFFYWNGNSWIFVEEKNGNSASKALFGYSVAINGYTYVVGTQNGIVYGFSSPISTTVQITSTSTGTSISANTTESISLNPSNSSLTNIIIGVSISVGGFLAFIVILMILFRKCSKKKDKSENSIVLESKSEKQEAARTSIRVANIEDDLILIESIGNGSFGEVYKGKIGFFFVAVKERKFFSFSKYFF